MGLSRRLFVSNAALITTLLALVITSLAGLNGLRATVNDVADEYEELQIVEEALVRLEIARTQVAAGALGASTLQNLQAASAGLAAFLKFQRAQEEDHPQHEREEWAAASAAQRELAAVTATLESTGPEAPAQATSLLPALDRVAAVLSRLAALTDEMRPRETAARRVSATLAVQSFLSLLVVIVAVAASIVAHRSVILPLNELRRGFQLAASGDLTHRVAAHGAPEFAELARDFNHMTAELESIHANLEEKVVRASKELARSERLASVGFLAAGVAHEINNPLHIISGYAELTRRTLDGPMGEKDVAEGRQALQVIRDEAFRCKTITERLLSLSRMNEGAHTRVSLRRVARDVEGLVRGLKRYADRELLVRGGERDDLMVLGNEDELKQVLLNIVVNGLEASPPGTGRVEIALSRNGRDVRLEVRDNGSGMTARTLERVFEPFFTARHEHGPPGVGLGLSIAHSIVEAHRGRITATSEGPGRGSTFVVEVPATAGGAGAK